MTPRERFETARVARLAAGAREMKALRFLPLALVALIVAALVWRLANPPDTNVESGMIGKPVPAFTAAAALPGQPALSSANLADGRPKLVNFFASWCVPCVGEAPVLTMLKQQGVPIVGIAVRDRPAAVDGQVVVRPEVTITATIDHRFIDGFQGGTLARVVREFFADPRGFDNRSGGSPPQLKAPGA